MRAIPPVIKSDIIRKHLEGYSIPEISKMLGVSVGTISTITSEESRNDEIFSYMREIAKKFKNDNLGYIIIKEKKKTEKEEYKKYT